MTTKQRAGRKAPPGGARNRMFQMRMNDLEFARLTGEAEKRGVNVAALVRSRIVDLIAPTATPEPPKVDEGGVDLATWLGGRLRLPTGIAKRYVTAGRVTVGGAVYREDQIARDALDAVALDGQPV